MTTYAVSSEDEVLEIQSGAPIEAAKLHIDHLQAEEPVVKAHGVGPKVIHSTEQPEPIRLFDENSSLSGNRISDEPPGRHATVTALAKDAGVAPRNEKSSVKRKKTAAVDENEPPVEKKPFPDLAFAAVQAGMMRERDGAAKLNKISGEIRAQLKDIDNLLDLNKEMGSNEQDSWEVTDEARRILRDLEARGVHVTKGELKKTLSRQELSELKMQVSREIEQSRSKMQTTITTEVQPEINNLNSIMNAIQRIINSDERLKKKCLELPH
jgi:hypothetical protein